MKIKPDMFSALDRGGREEKRSEAHRPGPLVAAEPWDLPPAAITCLYL